MPDELTARIDARGPERSRYQLTELLAYYRIQSEDRAKREWEAAIGKLHDGRKK